MFNIKVTEYKSHDLVFMLDEDDGFWFIIRHTTSANHVDSVAFGEGSSEINNRYGGDIERFIDFVLEESSKKVVAFFGEEGDLPPEEITNWRDYLQQVFQHGVEFKTSPSRIQRKG